MSEEPSEERRKISIRDIYQQLDDHVGPNDPPFDGEAGLERLMRSLEALEKEPPKDEPPQESV